ncbi:hypothetical protein FG386_000956 [Cryptosporidium ryanae]|uniref:uncharacterized protein n=1 Tax=Cryptosporidium ryanae TaxID=515981 RepID=UPI003519E10C|nr:hypothetical protein FG386_000956 [Cryptosporidium ryanae]
MSNAFFSARSSIASRPSQVIPNYLFQTGSLNDSILIKKEGAEDQRSLKLEGAESSGSLSNLNSETANSGEISTDKTLPRANTQTYQEKRLSNVSYYKPVYPNTGGPIYNSISTSSDEYKERLKASNDLRRAHTQVNWKQVPTPQKQHSLQSGNSCLLKSCEYLKISDYYKICNADQAIPDKTKKAPIIDVNRDSKLLSSIYKNIIQRGDTPVSQSPSTCPSSPEIQPNKGKDLKSMFSVKSVEKKQDAEAKQNELINEFKKYSTKINKLIYKQNCMNDDISPISCVNNAYSNIKGALNTLELTGKVFLDVILGIASVFDLDKMDINDKLNCVNSQKFNNLMHFPVSSIDLPPNNVVLQCFDCGLIYYAELPLNKQQLSTIGVLNPQAINFGIPDNADKLEFEIRNRNSPYYCWGNIQPRDLSPGQIEFIKTTDLRKANKFSLQDVVDIYYYRYRRDRRHDNDFPIFVLSDPQLHLYKFYRETMHGVYNGNKTPLPELGNCFEPSPWLKGIRYHKYPVNSSCSNKTNVEVSGSDNSNEKTESKFEKDENGFTILPQFSLDETNHYRDEYSRIIYNSDKTHVFPFVLDKLSNQ